MTECKACGYREGWDIDEGNIGDQHFIDIGGNFTVEDGWNFRVIPVSLKACPKCNTVIMVRD